MPDVKAYLVPFSHLDLFWLGGQEECLSRGNRIIAEALDMAAADPEFRFLLEDLVFVDHFLQCHPERKAELSERVRSGQVEIGPKWAGIDQTPQVGEDLVRNSLYAMEYLAKELGYAPRTMHASDLAGWTPQCPQILMKLGIPYAIFTRTGPEHTSLFNWRGLDGTKLLVWHARYDYGWAWHHGLEVSVEKAREKGLEREMTEVLSCGVEPILVHWGVDLILPARALPERLREWNRVSPLTMAFATPTEYFEKAPRSGLPELAGEAPTVWIYSDPQYPAYQAMTVPAVAALQNGELFSTAAWARGLLPDYPQEKIREAWLLALEAMDHNNNGQGNDLTVERKAAYYRSATFSAERLTERALRLVAENVRSPFGPECYPIVVFNPTSWPRTDIVRAHVTYHGDIVAFDASRYRAVELVDEQGNPVALQQTDTREGVSREDSLCFVAADVPACGYRTWYLRPVAAAGADGPGPAVRQEDWTFNTPFYALSVDKVTGALSLRDAVSGGVLARSLHVVGVEEAPGNNALRDITTGRRFEFLVESVDLEHGGPVQADIVVRGMVGTSRLEQRFTLYRDIRRIDITNTVDFLEWRPVRLQQVFDTGLEDPRSAYGVPYGVSTPENEIPTCRPRRGDEAPSESWHRHRNCIHWLDITGREAGLTIGTLHRCFHLEGGVATAEMLRGVVSHACVLIRDGKRAPHKRPPTGRYVFRYSLLPHRGGWADSRSYRAGWDLSHPLLPVTVGDSYSPKRLPGVDQFLALESTTDSLVLTVLKKAQEGRDLVVRFFETEGRKGTASLRLGGESVTSAWVCNLREEPQEALASLEDIAYRPWEIVTVRIHRQEEADSGGLREAPRHR